MPDLYWILKIKFFGIVRVFCMYSAYRCIARSNSGKYLRTLNIRALRSRIYFSSKLSISISATRCCVAEIEPPFGDAVARKKRGVCARARAESAITINFLRSCKYGSARRSWFYKRAPRVMRVYARTHTCAYFMCGNARMYTVWDTVCSGMAIKRNDVINTASIFSMDSFYTAALLREWISLKILFARIAIAREDRRVINGVSQVFPRRAALLRTEIQIARQSGWSLRTPTKLTNAM